MASSSSGSEFFVSGNCSHCSEFGMKLFLRRPGLAGRDRHHYTNLPGLPMHSQVITRSHNQCCPASTHQPVFSSVPVRYNSLSNCSRCRAANESVERSAPTGHHSHMATSVNTCWINPVEAGPDRNLNNTNLVHSPLRIQPCAPPGHVGMATVTPIDGVPYNMSALYHHHHHIHHYRHYTQSRNNLHPYALPVLHPRLHRQPSIHPLSPHNFLLASEAQVTSGRNLDGDPLENSVDIRELFPDLKPKGISKSVLENLPTYRVTPKDKHVSSESRCAICLMDFEQKQQLRILPCLHEYHSKCIDKWLKNNRSCPICRKEINIS